MSCFVIWSSPNSLYDCPAVLCSWGPPTSTKSPHTVAGMKAGFLLPPLRDIGPYNSWGLAVPTMNGPFWLSSAPNVLCVATCIIHEGGLMSSWVCCSFARIMGFDRIPCLAGPFVISVVITIPFLIAYPWWPLSATAEETPLSSYAEASWVNATTTVSFEAWPTPGLPFPFSVPPPLSPFPGFWAMPHLRNGSNGLSPFWFLDNCSEGLEAGRVGLSVSMQQPVTPSVLPVFTLGGGSSFPRLQPALSPVEKNSEGNIIFKNLNVLSGCFRNLTSGKRSLVQAWWLMWCCLLLITKRLKIQWSHIFACQQRISNPLTSSVLIFEFAWVCLQSWCALSP